MPWEGDREQGCGHRSLGRGHMSSGIETTLGFRDVEVTTDVTVNHFGREGMAAARLGAG